MNEQNHDRTTLRGLQRTLALQEVEVQKAAARQQQGAIDRERAVRELAERHAVEVAHHEQSYQQALAEREMIASQIAEIVARMT